MSKQSAILRFLFISVLFILICCNTSDDNNPSPVPDVRDKFMGDWKVTDECSKGNYIVNIRKDPSNSAQVLLQNFANSTASVFDTAIVAANLFFLYQQMNSEGWLIEGEGNYQLDGTIAWVFTLVISGTLESCTATYVKGKSL
jgi:hypothetical protein